MGTRGLFALFHKGKYYRVYHHHDSYFDGLGQAIVEELQAGDFTTVLAIWRQLLSLGQAGETLEPPTDAKLKKEWDAALEQLQRLRPHDKATGENIISRWFYDDFPYGDAPREIDDNKKVDEEPRSDGIFIEYIYVIDLDAERFMVTQRNSNFIFKAPVSNIPSEWAETAEDMGAPGTWADRFPLPGRVYKQVMEKLKNQGYQVVREVKAGRCATVYEAIEKESEKIVFIKVFSPLALDHKHQTCDRPLAIADLLLEKPHPNLVPIVKKLNLRHYKAIVLEAFGTNLTDAVDWQSSHPERELQFVCHSIGQVAEGIIFLHKHGAVHHGIEPGNILCRRDDNEAEGFVQAALCDFESIGVPAFGISDKRWENVVKWGPFKKQDTEERMMKRPRYSNDSDEEERERYYQGWHRSYSNGSWNPPKWMEGYAHPDRETACPWILDSYSLARVLEGASSNLWEGCSDGSDFDKMKPLVDEAVSLLETATDYDDAMANLAKVSLLLQGTKLPKTNDKLCHGGSLLKPLGSG